LKRGEVWVAASNEHYGSKPRPVVIVQADAFHGTESVVVCGLTTTGAEAVPLSRPEIVPSDGNGLQALSRVMVDKIVAVPRRRLGRCIGTLSDDEMARIERAIIVFLDLAG
jgi:mRNA interferase MazF